MYDMIEIDRFQCEQISAQSTCQSGWLRLLAKCESFDLKSLSLVNRLLASSTYASILVQMAEQNATLWKMLNHSWLSSSESECRWWQYRLWRPLGNSDSSINNIWDLIDEVVIFSRQSTPGNIHVLLCSSSTPKWGFKIHLAWCRTNAMRSYERKGSELAQTVACHDDQVQNLH